LGPAVAYTGLHPQNCNLSVSSRKVSAGYHSAFSAARRFFHRTIRLTVDAHRAAMVDGGSPVPIPQAVPRPLTSRSPGRLVDNVRNLIAWCCRLLGLVPTGSTPCSPVRGGGRHAGALRRHGVSAPVIPK
jgi:hypothetical protein